MKRHRWLKLRTHVYLCTSCGCGRENFHDADAGWMVRWHRSDGETAYGSPTPPCEPGPRGALALDKYAARVAESKGVAV